MIIKGEYCVVSLKSLFQTIKKYLFVCPECKRIFLHITKKKKIYCSNKCASRHIIRRKRKKVKYNVGNEITIKREEIIKAAKILKYFCEKFECDHNRCPFVHLGICGFLTHPPKKWVLAVLLEKE